MQIVRNLKAFVIQVSCLDIVKFLTKTTQFLYLLQTQVIVLAWQEQKPKCSLLLEPILPEGSTCWAFRYFQLPKIAENGWVTVASLSAQTSLAVLFCPLKFPPAEPLLFVRQTQHECEIPDDQRFLKYQKIKTPPCNSNICPTLPAWWCTSTLHDWLDNRTGFPNKVETNSFKTHFKFVS